MSNKGRQVFSLLVLYWLHRIKVKILHAIPDAVKDRKEKNHAKYKAKLKREDMERSVKNWDTSAGTSVVSTFRNCPKFNGDLAINIIFDGPPGPESGRFVEVETDNGKSIDIGEWIKRPDGLWALRITQLPRAAGKEPKT